MTLGLRVHLICFGKIFAVIVFPKLVLSNTLRFRRNTNQIDLVKLGLTIL